MVDIRNGGQFKPEFVAICPNSKIPAIVDQDGPDGKPLALFESGAILIYLADKTGRLIGSNAGGRYRVIEWVMFQMANVGPLFGQAHHFLDKTPAPIPYAIDRYVKEAARLYGVMEKRLGEVEYLAGDYSIADMTTYVWLRNPKHQRSEEHTSELQSRENLVCRLLLEKKKKTYMTCLPTNKKQKNKINQH